MPSESGDRRPARTQGTGSNPTPEPEHLPCPRCESTNTKFCYYNNYNLSQPRHFCKACRRYWTQGGTLRNIPVGGGSRKNSKRSRTATTAASTSSSSSTATTASGPDPIMNAVKQEIPMPLAGDVNLSGNTVPAGGFTSLLNTQGPGFLALNGLGLGLGSGFDDLGFGLGRGAAWPFQEVGEIAVGGNGGGGGGSGGVSGGATAMSGGGCNAWQLSGVESGFSEGDCFGWPDLAISMPGKGLK